MKHRAFRLIRGGRKQVLGEPRQERSETERDDDVQADQSIAK